MKKLIIYFIFILGIWNIARGQVIYPKAFNHLYYTIFNFNFDTIQSISEYEYYCNHDALLSEYLLSNNPNPEFKLIYRVVFSKGLVSKSMHYKYDGIDTSRYVYKDSLLISIQDISEIGKLMKVTNFTYSPSLIKSFENSDSLFNFRTFNYDSLGRLIKSAYITREDTIMGAYLYPSDTMVVDYLISEKDTLCIEKITIKQYKKNNEALQPLDLNAFICNEQGINDISRYVFNEYKNIELIQYFYNDNITYSEEFYYFLDEGIILSYKEFPSGKNVISKYEINK